MTGTKMVDVAISEVEVEELRAGLAPLAGVQFEVLKRPREILIQIRLLRRVWLRQDWLQPTMWGLEPGSAETIPSRRLRRPQHLVVACR
jgi:hypothetical protein